MNNRTPILTLAAVAVVGGALFAIDVVSDPTAPTATAEAAVTAAPAPTETPPPETPPPPGAPPEDAEAPAVAEKVYAGRSSGNEVTVAIAVRDGRAVAYVCDGKTIEAWLEGTLEGDTLALTGPNEASITGTVTEDGASSFGTVGAGGKQWPYSAKAVQAPEGLYEGRADVRGVANRIGWIVVDGRQVGLRTQAGERLPAPPLDPQNPGAIVLGGTPVTVTTVTGDDDVVSP